MTGSYFGGRLGFQFVSAVILFLGCLVPAQAQGPVVSSVAVYPIGNTTADILWVTDQTATSTVNYGTTSDYGQTMSVSPSNIYHAVALANLTPGTTYHYQIITTDSGGTTTVPDGTFMTTGSAPTQSGPVISGVAAFNATAPGVTITWTTDQPSSSQVYYGTSTGYGSQSSFDNTQVTSHSVTLAGLQSATTYDYAVVSTDSGGSTTSSNYTFSTSGGGGGGTTSTGSGPWSTCGVLLCPASQVGVENNSIGVQMANHNDGVEVLNNSNAWLLLVPSLGQAGYNHLSQSGDQGLIFGGSTYTAQAGGLVIAPWTASQTGGIRVDPSGNVGIGVSSPQHMLHVAGTIGAEEVIVSSTGADYVFEPGYRLMPLSEVAAYIARNHHLPDVPSAKEVQEKGAGLGDMQAKLLAKVEELTLHMIRLEKDNEELRRKVAKQGSKGSGAK